MVIRMKFRLDGMNAIRIVVYTLIALVMIVMMTQTLEGGF